MFLSVNLLSLERGNKTKQEKQRTNGKFKASKNILESRLQPPLWRVSDAMKGCSSSVPPTGRPGGLCFFFSASCRRRCRCRLGLLLRGGGGRGGALWLDDLVGDQVFWVGLQTHSSRAAARGHLRSAGRGKHAEKYQILTGLVFYQ